MAPTMGRPMRMRLTSLVAAVVVVLSLPALAGPGRGNSIRRELADSGDRLDDVLEKLARAPAGCRANVEGSVGQLLDAIDALRPSDDVSRFDQTVSLLGAAQNMAKLSGCPDDVVRDMNRAAADLADAARDVRRRQPPAPPPPPAAPAAGSVGFATPQVQDPGMPGPMLVIPSIVFNNMRGQQVYFAWHWRHESGQYGPWESMPAFVVATPQYVWPNPYKPQMNLTTLRGADPQGTGRFVAHAGIFDMSGRELNGVDVPFTVRYPPGAPPVPPGRMLPANPGLNPPPPPGQRDCGLGLDDPGCNVTRGGAQAMLKGEYDGFYASLRAQLSESGRAGMVRDTLNTRWITARQLGNILDLFIGENNRLDAARFALPHVTDPSNAFGFGTKFLSQARQREYNQLVSAQR